MSSPSEEKTSELSFGTATLLCSFMRSELDRLLNAPAEVRQEQAHQLSHRPPTLPAQSASQHIGDPTMPDPALEPEELTPEDDVHHASQAVYGELESAAEYLTYMTGKCATWRKSGKEKWPRAQMGEQTEEWPGNAGDPCVIIEQYGSVLANVSVKVAGGKITRLDMCHIAPTPGSAIASGVYPV